MAGQTHDTQSRKAFANAQLSPWDASRIGTGRASCCVELSDASREIARSLLQVAWYMPMIYTMNKVMAKSKVAKLFRNGRSQAVRLPKEFRFQGDCVRVRQVGVGVWLEPIISDAAEWLAELRRLNIETLLPQGRKQPRATRRRSFI